MENKNRLLASYFFFILGLSLIILSWVKSYPISMINYKYLIIRHFYLSYFIGVSISLVSLFFIISNTKRTINKLFCIFGFIFLFFSSNFFYPLLPGSDSHSFRGMTKYFIENTNPNINVNGYFQWPGLFIFAKGLSFITQIKDVNTLATIIFLIVGFILSTSLYFIFKYQNEKNAPLIAIIYFFIMFYFINYQYAAQSLAIAILFGMIALTLNKEKDNKLWIIILFCILVITHAFMAVFFIFYLIGCSFFFKIFKNKEVNKNISTSLLIVCSIIYLFYLSFIAVNLFNSLGKVVENSALEKNNINLNIFTRYINLALRRPIAYNDYLVQKEVFNISELDLNEQMLSGIANSTNLINVPQDILQNLYVQKNIIDENNPNLFWIKVDNYSQLISRGFIISLIVLLIIGFVTLFFQKKVRIELLSIGVAGFLYMIAGTLMNILGERGIQLLTVPLVTGAIFFLDNKKLKKSFLVYFGIILLIAFPLAIIHSNFDNQLYQEYHEKVAGDYFINKINHLSQNEKLSSHFFIFGRHEIVYYVAGAIDLSQYIWIGKVNNRDIPNFNFLKINKFDYIFINDNLKKELIKRFKVSNQDIAKIENEYYNTYNIFYNNRKTKIYSID